ncbi:MAG: putative rane protein [Paenibacillaceae bacterium]|nr:putative rane protein [Paenibacillaceae bacterium]
MNKKNACPKRLIMLLLGTFALKCLLIAFHGHHYDYGSDDRGYLESARILAEEGRFTYNDPERPTLFITPALPGTLALLYKLAGGGEGLAQTFRYLQAAMVTGGLYLLFAVGRRIFNERTAYLAVLLASFYPPLWLMSMFIFTESLFLLFLMLLFYTALRAMDEPSPRWALAFGLLWAAAVYIRPTIALWPGLVFLFYLYGVKLPWRRLVRCGLITSVVLVLCLMPWWVRNYQVSEGRFIPLTQSGGNPLLLGTYPFTVPALFMEEQKTWHTTNDQRVNDQQDTARAVQRIKEGFSRQPLLYISWYTVGKLALFWGDVFYWMALPGVPLAVAVLYHYALLIPGFLGLYRSRRQGAVKLVLILFGYMSLLHTIYLAHSRYSAPLMPLLALFAAHYIMQLSRGKKRDAPQIHKS